MSKKSAKIAVTYVVTILVTLLVVGAFGMYMLKLISSKETKDPSQNVVIDQMVSSDEYEPSVSDNRTVLLILDTEKRESASCFLIARFLAVEKQLVFMPLPSNTKAAVDGSADSLYNFYRNGGTASAVKAVENCTGVKIDKFIKFNKDSFTNIIDIFGGVDYDIPYNLIYDNPTTGEETIIREGETYLDSSTMRKVLTYPNYNSGEEYRAKCLGIIITDMINTNVDANFASHLDDYFSSVINSTIETDITSYDYDEISNAMKYVIRNYDRLATFVLTSGTNDENGLYELDANFVKSITEWLKLYDENGDPQ